MTLLSEEWIGAKHPSTMRRVPGAGDEEGLGRELGDPVA